MAQWHILSKAQKHILHQSRKGDSKYKIHSIHPKNKLELLALSTFGSSALLWQQHGLDVWQHTALGNGHSGQQLVQLLVITDGKLQTIQLELGRKGETRGLPGDVWG